MTKKKSVKGLLIYFLIGIIALFFSILLGISTNPNQLEQLSEMIGDYRTTTNVSLTRRHAEFYFIRNGSCYWIFYCS